MAPTRPSHKGKPAGKLGSSAKKSTASKAKSTGPTGISKRKQKSQTLLKPGGAQKTKSRSPRDGKKKKRVYTEAELDIPKLNGIIPAGIAKPRGQKKGKKFVDDAEGMLAIMSVVNAEKEGQVESKIMRARQLEEVREAKRREAEKRSHEREKKFEEKKQTLKRKRHKASDSANLENAESEAPAKDKRSDRKRVSFG